MRTHVTCYKAGVARPRAAQVRPLSYLPGEIYGAGVSLPQNFLRLRCPPPGAR